MKWILNRKLAWFVAFLTWVVGDVETTMYGMTRGLKEGNPVMKPFVKRGRWALYPVKTACFLVMYWKGRHSVESGWGIAIYGASVSANNLGQTVVDYLTRRERMKGLEEPVRVIERITDNDP